MPRIVIATCAGVILGFQLIHAQTVSPPLRRSVATQTATPGRLPVRRVVLYKNGVGYFERVGKVRGTEVISIDFDSAQLDDVLNSLTALDLGNGRISRISYNSDAPIGQRLGALRLPVGDRPTLPEFLTALRGARLDVRVGDRIVTGRLLGVERRPGGTPGGASRDWLSLVGDRGDPTDRTVVIEHPTRPGWTLVDGLQPAETSATAYRFKVAAPGAHTTTLTVEERQPLQDRYEVAALRNPADFGGRTAHPRKPRRAEG